MLSSPAVAAELSAGTLRPVTITGLRLERILLTAWPAGQWLTGPARDLHTIATRLRHTPILG